MKKTIVLGLVIAMVVFSTGTSAQRHQKMNKGMHQMNPEIKTYVEDNILPVMKVQRHELDKELSQTEKTRLDEIRAELKTLRQQKAEKFKEMRMKEDRPDVEQRQEMREMRNEMHNLMDEVAIMAENHDATITRLLGEVSTETDQWRQDIRAIMEKNRADCVRGEDTQKPGKGNRNNRGMGYGGNQGKGNRGNQGMGNRGNNRGNPGMYYGDGMPLRRLLNPQTFLLWDTDKPMPFFDGQNGLGENLKLNVYPNPASHNTQISIQLENEATVGFIIFDKDGNEVMDLGAEHSAAGLYSKTIDVSDLNNGLYLIKIIAGEKTSIGRFIVQH